MNHSRVVNNNHKMYDIYIGRPSKWGNPFTHLKSDIAEYKVKTREESIQAYALWVQDQHEIMGSLHELQGMTLGCFCDPEPCHGSILALLTDYTHEEITTIYETDTTDITDTETFTAINNILRKTKTPIIITGGDNFKDTVVKIISHINKQKQDKIIYITLEDHGNRILTERGIRIDEKI